MISTQLALTATLCLLIAVAGFPLKEFDERAIVKLTLEDGENSRNSWLNALHDPVKSLASDRETAALEVNGDVRRDRDKRDEEAVGTAPPAEQLFLSEQDFSSYSENHVATHGNKHFGGVVQPLDFESIIDRPYNSSDIAWSKRARRLAQHIAVHSK